MATPSAAVRDGGVRSVRPRLAAALGLAVAFVTVGCTSGPRLLPDDKRQVIDRAVVERPSGLELTTLIPDLTAPTSIAFVPDDDPTKDADGTPLAGGVIVATGGFPERARSLDPEPRVFGFRPDGTRFDVYPKRNGLFAGLASGRRIYGPIGGLAVREGEVYVSHRDDRGMGTVSAFKLTDGTRRTVVADLPSRGDFSVTDLAFHPANGRLYFGVGAATNSGVVGLDNWALGWVRAFEDFCDRPAVDLRLREARFDTPNPAGGLFGGNDVAVTGPFQPFGSGNRLRIPPPPNGKPSASVYSISPGGGDLRVEAHGLRHPRGLVFNQYGNLFVTNQGMEMRGTRPVKDDPDAVLRVPPGGGTWFGWPDFSADLVPITDARFQPPPERIVRTGYPEIRFLIDHNDSGLIRPDRETLVRGVFPSLSGAAKMTFVDEQAGFEPSRGQLLVALGGDRFPFATGGTPLLGPVGYKVVRLDPDTRGAVDFVYNTSLLPASAEGRGRGGGLERPVDVKFGPDGALYVVDLGRVEYRDDGRPRVRRGTGKVLRLAPPAPPTTRPASRTDRRRESYRGVDQD